MIFKSKTQLTGAAGEDECVKYLIEHGYSIISRNFCVGKKEIDIIAVQKPYIAFIEVKTRCADERIIRKFGRAAAAVDRQKLDNIKSAANAFLGRYADSVKDLIPRIDVMEVLTVPAENKVGFVPTKINHIINVSLR